MLDKVEMGVDRFRVDGVMFPFNLAFADDLQRFLRGGILRSPTFYPDLVQVGDVVEFDGVSGKYGLNKVSFG